MNRNTFLEKSRESIRRDFAEFAREFPQAAIELQKRLPDCSEEERLSLQYLYANAPYSDVGNYSFEVFFDFARHAVMLWRDSVYLESIPEELFLQYVLYHRVNDEEIKPCRAFFLAEMKKDGLRFRDDNPIERMILDINYWCASKVTYHTTDARTASALDIYRCGFGRCGEESVFAVNVLRSMGIPARQVYVPKWSHCDDNHAWVEIWCSGKWQYFGACEPEEVLNKGWFDHAASRAMMIHAREFRPYNTEKRPIWENAGKEGINQMKNQLPRYARTIDVTIHILKSDLCPADGAAVNIQVLNYAELSNIASMNADKDGMVQLRTGKGSLYIEAIWGGYAGNGIFDTRKSSDFSVILQETCNEQWKEFDMIAPADTAGEGLFETEEIKKENRRRLKIANRIREERICSFVPEWKLHFLPEQPELAQERMQLLSTKDRIDADQNILNSHFRKAQKWRTVYSEELFWSAIWNPRIENEPLSDWRTAAESYFTESERKLFLEKPVTIWQWIEQHIQETPEREHGKLYTNPEAVLKMRRAGDTSKKVLFVAIARTSGVPARIRKVDGEPEYWKDGWILLSNAMQSDTISADSLAGIELSSKTEIHWEYYHNWTLARWTSRGYHSLNITDEKWTENRYEVQLPSGRYRILTTNRLPSGNQFACQMEFDLKPGQKRTIQMQQRSARLEDMLRENVIPNQILMEPSGRSQTLESLTEKNTAMIFWLDPGKEPTEHILNELIKQKDAFGQYADRMIFVLEQGRSGLDQTLQRCLELLPQIRVYYGEFEKMLEMTARRMYVDPDQLPLIIFTHGTLKGIYAVSGYAVGTGNMLLTIQKYIETYRKVEETNERDSGKCNHRRS